ncbi:zinc ribbon domain-containing protein [Bifidobacterium rousetti]|uniref:zinc ribbon domain-containing protein n=1 Tax=Bifidobacterium rousetti TaxID=2045439 RepID=UPI00168AEE17|nr:zinc ribbon domain-containing protein [Bifidobacterium rousetti]
MSMMMCPECGTNISEQARVCPYCGFCSADADSPIQGRSQYEIVPSLAYDVTRVGNDGEETIDTLEIVADDRRRLLHILENWDHVRLMMPGIVQFLQQTFAEGDAQMVAKLPRRFQQLVEEGKLHFQQDLNGETLAALFDDKGHIVKQVRLEMSEQIPDLLPTIQHLQTQAAISMVLSEIKDVKAAVHELHVEQQNDRLAKVDTAWDMFLQARAVTDRRLRDQLLMHAIMQANDARSILARNFEEQMHAIADPKRHGKKDGKAADALNDLTGITDTIQIACNGYIALGQPKASHEVLHQFRTFIRDNDLADEDTLIRLNEHLSIEAKSKASDRLDRLTHLLTGIAQSQETWPTTIGRSVNVAAIGDSAQQKEYHDDVLEKDQN